MGGGMGHPECVPTQGGVPFPAVLRDNFRLQPGDLVATAGQVLELDCVPPAGHPEPRVSWRKDGVTLRPAGGRHQVTRGKLRVAPARRTDAGVYVCVAANAAGERHSRGAHVTVLGKWWWCRGLGHGNVPRNLTDVPSLQRSQPLCGSQVMPWWWLVAQWSWAAVRRVIPRHGCSGTKRMETCPGGGRWWQGGSVTSPGCVTRVTGYWCLQARGGPGAHAAPLRRDSRRCWHLHLHSPEPAGQRRCHRSCPSGGSVPVHRVIQGTVCGGHLSGVHPRGSSKGSPSKGVHKRRAIQGVHSGRVHPRGSFQKEGSG